MPFVLKDPVADSPGIIIFTHKERRRLECTVPAVRIALRQLRQRYVFGMHWGAYNANVVAPDIVDFHLVGPGTASFAGSVRRIPLCSRNFTPACFQPMPLTKYWDVLNISRPIRQKRLDDFFRVVRKVYDRGCLLRVLLLCPWPVDMRDQGWWYRELVEDYASLFSEHERQYFTLMRLQHGPVGAFPLSQETIAYFYNASKVFCLFSQHEGESRVISEALLCGLPVVVRETLLGGGRDYLNPQNSRQFNSLDQAADYFIELASDHQRCGFDTIELEHELSEKYSCGALSQAMNSLFDELGYPFGGGLRLENLARRLPGHEVTLPANLREVATNDLRSFEATLIYANQLSGRPTKMPEQALARLWDIAERSGRFARTSLVRAKSFLIPGVTLRPRTRTASS